MYSVKINVHPSEHVCMKQPINPAASALLQMCRMQGMTGGRIVGEWGFKASRLKCQKAHSGYTHYSKALSKE